MQLVPGRNESFSPVLFFEILLLVEMLHGEVGEKTGWVRHSNYRGDACAMLRQIRIHFGEPKGAAV
jgi:hypothetical protein